MPPIGYTEWLEGVVPPYQDSLRIFDSSPRSRNGALIKMVRTVKNQRPVNLDLSTIKLPLPAIASITHRIAGIAIFGAMAFVLWGLSMSLESEASFNELASILDSVVAKLILWLILAGFIYHFIAGLKHLLMDAGYFETLEGANLLAKIVIGSSAVLILLAGVWIW